jgi:hypothetical protein
MSIKFLVVTINAMNEMNPNELWIVAWNNNVIGLLLLRRKLMLWLFPKLFENQCDWVAFIKAKANVVIVFEVVRRPMRLGCFRQDESQYCDRLWSCLETNVIGFLSLRKKPTLWLFPKLFEN